MLKDIKGINFYSPELIARNTGCVIKGRCTLTEHTVHRQVKEYSTGVLEKKEKSQRHMNNRKCGAKEYLLMCSRCVFKYKLQLRLFPALLTCCFAEYLCTVAFKICLHLLPNFQSILYKLSFTFHTQKKTKYDKAAKLSPHLLNSLRNCGAFCCSANSS